MTHRLLRTLAALAIARGSTSEHQPGDSHRYRIECEVCGQRGQVQLSVEPQIAESDR